jgi:hypothetical protein
MEGGPLGVAALGHTHERQGKREKGKSRGGW